MVCGVWDNKGFRLASIMNHLYNSFSLTRGGAVWQLVGLITRRSQVQILPPQPICEAQPFSVGLFALRSPGIFAVPGLSLLNGLRQYYCSAPIFAPVSR